MKITKEQKYAIQGLYKRRSMSLSYKAFRKLFKHHLGGYIGAVIEGIFVGIEPDGYTHT